MSRRWRARATVRTMLLGLGMAACGPRSIATTVPNASPDRDLRVVIAPRWEVAQVVSTPMEALGFRAGPTIARSVHHTGLGELVLRDVRADRHLATLAEDTYEPDFIEQSADATKLAVALADGTLELWDAEHGRHVASLGRPPHLRSLWFSDDGSTLVGAAEDGGCRIWDGRTGQLRHLLPELGPKVEARPSPDGRRVVTTGTSTVLWNAIDGRRVATIVAERSRTIEQVRFSPDGRTFVAPEVDGAALWSTEDGRRLATLLPPPGAESASVYWVSWSSRGGLVALRWLGPDVLTVHSVTDGRTVWSTPADVRTIAFSPAEDSMAVTTWGAYSWISLRDGVTLSEGMGDVRGAVFRPGVDGPTMFLRRPEEIVSQGRAVETHALDDFTTLRLADDGRTVVANERSEGLGRSYGEPVLLDARTLGVLSPPTGHAIVGARYLPDGDTIVSGGHRVRTWDADGLAPRATCPHVEAFGRAPIEIAILEDGAAVAAIAGETLAVFELQGTKCRLREQHKGLVAPAAMLSQVRPQARTLALLQTDPTYYWMTIRTTGPGGGSRALDGYYDTATLDPTGELLLAASYDGSLRALDLAGERWRFGPVSEEHEAGLMAIAVAPRGDRIAAVDDAGQVRLFEPATAEHRVVHRLGAPQEGWGIHHELAFADADTLLVQRDQTLHIVRLDAEPSGEVPTLSDVQGFGVHPDGEQLVLSISGGCDPTVYGSCRGRATIRFVALDGLVERSSVPSRGPGLGRFDFAPDGRSLVATGAGAMQQLRAPGK